MIEILFEDNHCLALNKPAGLLSQGDSTGDPSLLDLARDYLKVTYAKPGNVFVGLVHRLDRPTSGLVIVARTSKAASRLSEQFRDGLVEKTYHAVVEGTWPDAAGQWEDWLIKDERTNVVATANPQTPGAQRAGVQYRILDRQRRSMKVELRPSTGRGHQLRVQLASRGLPIVGDRKYGARSTLIALDGQPRIALHARSLRFKHPTRPEFLTLEAPFPADWPEPDGSFGSD
jgi:23S rRNA pseudouridine1911/1915/1917 synthase